MASDFDRHDKRKKRRDLTSCSVEKIVPVGDILPSGKKAPDCSVQVTPLAEQFISPEPCPISLPPATIIPEPLELLNYESEFLCPNTAPKDGPIGDPVTVSAGTYTLLFHFVKITGITANQLTFISTISLSERDELVDPSVTESRVIEITGLSSTQSQELINGVSAVQATVNDISDTAAYDGLICYWENTEQQSDCPSGALLNSDKSSLPAAQHSNINNPSIVAAGTFTSTVSQAEADLVASDEAEALLLCLYGNDEATRSCLDIGYAEDITDVDSEVDTLDGQKRKGYSTVTENTVFSNISKTEADAAAAILAESTLNCFYPNEEVTVTCAGEGRVAGVEGDTGPPIGDPITGQQGQSITVPSGYLISPIDTATANQLAEDYALSLLECWICNAEYTAECPDENYVDSDGNDVAQEPSVLSSPITVTIAKCFVKSEISQEDADTRAEALGDTQLGCIYCNDQIDPECVPEGYETPPVDITDYDRRTWSKDATRGAVEDTYCCRGAGAAQNCYEIAEGVSSVPIDSITGGDDCRYGNDEILGTCDLGAQLLGSLCLQVYDPIGDTYEYLNYPKSLIDVTDSDKWEWVCDGLNTQISCYEIFRTDTGGWEFDEGGGSIVDITELEETVTGTNFEFTLFIGDCSSDSPPQGTGKIGDFTGVPADTFFMGATEGGKDTANQVALDFADAASVCYWVNTTQTATCTAATCDLWAAGAITNSIVEYGSIVSFSSQAEADSTALLIAESRLNCVYTNKCVYISTTEIDSYSPIPTESQIETAVGAAWEWVIGEYEEGNCVTRAATMAKIVEEYANIGITVTLSDSGESECPTDEGFEHCSEAASNPCVEFRCGPDSMATGVVTSNVSVENATQIASSMLLGEQQCQSPNTGGGGGGGAGADGKDGDDGDAGNDAAQTDCGDVCYSYYS